MPGSWAGLPIQARVVVKFAKLQSERLVSCLKLQTQRSVLKVNLPPTDPLWQDKITPACDQKCLTQFSITFGDQWIIMKTSLWLSAF